MKTSIATVSISGSLTEKLHACAAAGFDGVEIFEPDLIASDHSPEEIRCLARRLGLSLDLYQPLRDIEGVDEETFAENLRRAGATFATAQRLGIEKVLVCSNVATATVDSDEISAGQLRRLGDLAQKFDHVNLAQRWQTADEAVLCLTSIFGLSADAPTEVAGPTGLVRSQVMRTVDGAVRLPLNVAPHVLDDAGMPQHVAFACTDVVEVARRARARGLPFLSVPDNYYDYVAGRFGVDAETVAELRELDLLYDRSPDGEFVHFYTRTVGSVFFEFVERRGHYDGYGTDNAPVRLAAQRSGRVGSRR